MKKVQWVIVLAALVLVFSGLGMARAEIIPPRGMGQIGIQALVTCEELIAREAPDESAKAVETLGFGNLIIVEKQENGWARCFLSDSEDGGPAVWVKAEGLTMDPAWFWTEEKAEVYAWNDTAAPRVAVLEAFSGLPVLKEDGEWLVVSVNGATGWIYLTSGN